MSLLDESGLMILLPLLIPALGLAYVAIVGFGGAALRLKRKQRAREREAERRATPPSNPWHDWLHEIEKRTPDRLRKDGLEEKWRE